MQKRAWFSLAVFQLLLVLSAVQLLSVSVNTKQEAKEERKSNFRIRNLLSKLNIKLYTLRTWNLVFFKILIITIHVHLCIYIHYVNICLISPFISVPHDTWTMSLALREKLSSISLGSALEPDFTSRPPSHSDCIWQVNKLPFVPLSSSSKMRWISVYLSHKGIMM